MATLIKQELTATWSGVRLIRLNEQVGTLLNEIDHVPNVLSACVCDNRGKLLGALVNGAWDAGEFNLAGVAIAQCFAAFQSKTECRDLEFRFEKKWLYARELGNAFVVVFYPPEMNLALLRMTLNVAAATFAADPELQKHLTQVAASKRDTLAHTFLDILGAQLVEQGNLLK